MLGNRHTHTQTHRHTDTQTKYRNPRCACAPRVNNSGCGTKKCMRAGDRKQVYYKSWPYRMQRWSLRKSKASSSARDPPGSPNGDNIPVLRVLRVHTRNMLSLDPPYRVECARDCMRSSVDVWYLYRYLKAAKFQYCTKAVNCCACSRLLALI